MLKDNIFIEFIISILLIVGSIVIIDNSMVVLCVIVGISLFFLIRILYTLKDILDLLRKQRR